MIFIIAIFAFLEMLFFSLIIIGAFFDIKDRKRIIHCKDCWKDGTPNCAMRYDCDCGSMRSWNEGDDFCSWGEREEND